jgi:small-conductance mechanosensitive channel
VTPALAIAASVGAAVLAVAAVALVSRRLRLVRRLSFPLYVAALAGGLKLYQVLVEEEPGALGRALDWILLFLVVILVLRILGLYVFDIYLHGHRGVRLPPLLPAVTMGLVYFVAAIVTLRVIYPALPLAALLTTSAVTSLVLGLALQPILGNFFAGIVISLEQPFRINDWILYEDVEARVAKVTWRTTHLRTRSNDTVVVPNAKIADSRILNYFLPHPLHMERITVGVHYRTPPYRVEQALLEVAERSEAVLKKPTPSVFLKSFDDSAITYELRVWVEDIANLQQIGSHVRSEIWEEFRRRDITIPFPIRTLEIEPRARTLELARPPSRAAQEEGAGAPPAARLYVSHGPDRGSSYALDGEVVTVGRSSACTYTVTEPRASKEHLRVAWRDGAYHAEDLGSQNGTLVNGQALAVRALRHLDHVAIGDTVLIFECEPDDA